MNLCVHRLFCPYIKRVPQSPYEGIRLWRCISEKTQTIVIHEDAMDEVMEKNLGCITLGQYLKNSLIF